MKKLERCIFMLIGGIKMKTMIITMILSIVYLVVMDVINKKLSTLDFSETSQIQETQTSSSYFSVNISGAITNPGTYTVLKGENLGYLITLAGGVSENADSSAYNLSAILSENTSYYIPFISSEGDKISINSATVAMLDTLPGIGSVIAKRIVSYRASNGNFKTIEELKNVNGIGDVLFQEIKDLICL